MLKVLQIFSDSNFIPHGHCYHWKPGLVWLHLGSDLIIGFSCFSILLLLTYFLRHRPDIPFRKIFWLFCAFIIAYGTTHLMEVWTLWQPYYWLSGLFKALTAGVSLYTAGILVHLISKALAVPNSLTQVETANAALAIEIQKHQKTESEVQECTQRLSLLIEQTPLAVIEWTPNFEVVDWNPSAEKIFGYSKQEALGRHAIELIVPQSASEQVNQVWTQLLLQQGGTRSTNENLTKDGQKIYCEWYNTPLINSEGQVIGVASLSQDITERKLAQEALQKAKNDLEIRVEARTQELKQALGSLEAVVAQLQSEIEQRQQVEAALREREEQYRTVVDNVKEVIFQTDTEGLWTFLNPAWSEITGFAIAQSLGTPLLDYVHPDDRQRNLEQFQPLIEGKKEYCCHELRYLTASGGYRWIEVLALVTFDGEGTITGTCGTLYDITERKQAEDALAKRERYLAALVEVQRWLLGFKGDSQYGSLNLNPYTEILKLLGQVSGASRVYVFENHWDTKGRLLMSQKGEWCTLGIHPEIDNVALQNLCYDDFFPRWAQYLAQDEIIAGVVAEFPESERIVLELQGILSILVLPLTVNGKFFGFIGFDNCIEARPWQASEVDLLRAAAAAVSLWHESFLAHKALRQSEARLRKQHRALSELAKCQSLYSGNLSVALQDITRAAASTLDADRCSVWLYNEDHSSLHCVDLYELTPHRHSAGYELTTAQYPNYFKALQADRIIAATDTHSDPRTQEFSASYLTQLGITSILNVPIRLRGVTVGVLCTEHIGSKRQWTLEEQNFGSTVAYMAALAMEASNRAAAEKALRASEEQFRQLTENLREVFFLVAPDVSQILYISPAYEEVWGRTTKSLYERPRSWLDSVHPQDRDRVAATLARHLNEEQNFHEEYRIVRPDGSVRWVWVRAFRVLNEVGVVTRLAGIAEDITEHKQAEEALRRSEAKYRALLEQIPAVTYMAALDETSTTLYISPQVEVLLGYSQAQWQHHPNLWYQQLHPDDRERVFAQLADTHAKGEPFVREYRLLTRAGGVLWIRDEAVVVTDEAGNPLFVQGVMFDITKRKRAEVEIMNALAREKELCDLKSRFVSIASHEFRTPLATIMSTAELLEYYEWPREEEVEQLHLIQEAVKQMLQLLEDVLFIGTADAGQIRFNPEPLALNEFCQELVAEIQRGMSLNSTATGIQHTKESCPCTINFVSRGQSFLACMDKKLLRQLLSNLLSNAIKYSPDGGTVHFDLVCQGDEAIFQIQDRGIGIPKEDQPRLFEFFHRGKNVGAIAGTGLGLAIVKTCVGLHRGHITVQSEVGVGTQFTVTLPMKNHFCMAPYAETTTT